MRINTLGMRYGLERVFHKALAPPISLDAGSAALAGRGPFAPSESLPTPSPLPARPPDRAHRGLSRPRRDAPRNAPTSACAAGFVSWRRGCWGREGWSRRCESPSRIAGPSTGAGPGPRPTAPRRGVVWWRWGWGRDGPGGLAGALPSPAEGVARAPAMRRSCGSGLGRDRFSASRIVALAFAIVDIGSRSRKRIAARERQGGTRRAPSSAQGR